jgi:hypothetical protein
MPTTDIDAQRQELMQNYDGLNSLEQAIVQLFAVVYQSINVGQIDPLLAERIEQGAADVDRIRRAAAIGDRYGPRVGHSQISLVQSPPG